MVIPGPGDARAAAHSRLRASDADREQVIDSLKIAFAQAYFLFVLISVGLCSRLAA